MRAHTTAVLRALSTEGLFRIAVLDQALASTNTCTERQTETETETDIESYGLA